MTGLRTIWGISLGKIEADYGVKIKDHLLQNSKNLSVQTLL